MTPDDAARILGVAPGASLEEIERAFRARARESHPDLLPDAPRERVAAASEAFVRLTDARALLTGLRDREPGVPVVIVRRRPLNRWALALWCAALGVGLIVSILGGPAEYSLADIALRLVPLAIAAVGFAVTGRSVFLIVLIATTVVSLALTLVFATFGSLLALEVLLVPVLGLAWMGWQTRRRVTREVGRDGAVRPH
ncbi:J domain-containing protein [Galbitalea soli]|uniref:J domain-containing protein n=1 Tax=Galbitalea soli TaxID=1268042 RepID=A0A7C9PLB1_9MICO|nr:J domain-containing protein [Galbitalea soli]NEM90110.1 J domain-containing protein [Galbitalea soli]NYJ30817.1 hypothetical protein [Galbitalea soli]